jgi:hypothetical protein
MGLMSRNLYLFLPRKGQLVKNLWIYCSPIPSSSFQQESAVFLVWSNPGPGPLPCPICEECAGGNSVIPGGREGVKETLQHLPSPYSHQQGWRGGVIRW